MNNINPNKTIEIYNYSNSSAKTEINFNDEIIFNQIDIEDVKSKGMTETENQEKADDKYNKLGNTCWIFDKNHYSKEEFNAKFNKIMGKKYGKKWWDTK